MLDRSTSPGSIDGGGVPIGSVDGGGVVSTGGAPVGSTVGSGAGDDPGVGRLVSAATWLDGATGSGAGEHAAATRATASMARNERPLTRLIARIVTAAPPLSTWVFALLAEFVTFRPVPAAVGSRVRSP